MDRFRPDEPDQSTEAERVDVGKRLAAALGQPTAAKAYTAMRFGLATLVMNGVDPQWLLVQFIRMMTDIADGGCHGFGNDGRVLVEPKRKHGETS